MQPWKKLGEKLVYDHWRRLIQREFLLPDGKKATFDIIGNNPYVTVAAFTHAQEVIITRQWRPGPEMELVSFAEGYIDAGETPLDAARRELLEETGYAAKQVRSLSVHRRGYTTDEQHVILAWDCHKVAAPSFDQHEFIQTEIVSLEDFRKLLIAPGDPAFTNIGPAHQALSAMGFL